jgi:hypothetical protein
MSLPKENENYKEEEISKPMDKKEFFDRLKDTDFYDYINRQAMFTGKSKDDIVYEVFNNNGEFLTVQETATVLEESSGGGAVGQTPVISAYATPKVIDDLDELRRLRREFSPISKAVEYILSMILGNKIEIIIEDPEETNQVDSKKRIQQLIANIYQDRVTKSLYTLSRILLDKALTDGVGAAEITYEKPIKFTDYIEGIDTTVKGLVYKTKEPDWKELKSINQLKIIDNAPRRLKVYKHPVTWEFNYITLDEVMNSGESGNDLKSLSKVQQNIGQTMRYHPWQVFWLAVNRRDNTETGLSVIAPVKKIALILEKVLQSVGEAAYRNANKKYALIMGDDKHNIGKVQQRNTLQLFNEMGKKGWSAIPVPAGFDYKEFGGTAYDASNVINTLLILIAEGMHVPVDVLGVARVGNEGSKTQTTTTFNEIEQMRYEFKQAIIEQLFKTQLYCEIGKTRNKQGGKGVASIFVPDIHISTKGLLSPIDELESYKSFLNAANPLSPELKYEMERRIKTIYGFDEVKYMSAEEYAKQVKSEKDMQMQMKKIQLEQTQIGLKQSKKNLEAPVMSKGAGGFGGAPKTSALSGGDKRQGDPEAPSEEKQKKRLENGVNKPKSTKQPSNNPKSVGSTRKPKIVAETMLFETWDREGEDEEFRKRRIGMVLDAQSKGTVVTHEDIDKFFIMETLQDNQEEYTEEG